jgi:hypothetical protein
MTNSLRRLAWVLLIAHVFTGVSALRAAITCDPRITGRVFDTGSPEQIALWGPAKERLLRIQNTVGHERWNRVANDVIDLVDPNVGTLERVTIHDWVKVTTNTAVGDEEIAAVILAVEGLRDSSGLPHIGLFRKSGVGDGSRRWILIARNNVPGVRGALFEPVAVRNLIRDGEIDPGRLVGLQIKMASLEGDAVELLSQSPVRYRFWDAKARDGNYDLNELEDAYLALTNPASGIDEVVFAIEQGTFAPSSWVAKFDAITERLVLQGGLTEAEARRRLSIRSAGLFR